MGNVKVSVIIPIFNASKYISKTLSSVINQNFSDYEIIVVDDGSEDDSLDLAYNILSKSNISHYIIHQRNSGVSVARNNGMEVAKGDFILFVDDDDYISENHISSLYNCCISNKTDFALSKLLKIDDNKNKLTNMDEYTFVNNKDIISSFDLIKLELEMKIPFSFVQLIYKSSILKEANLRFNQKAVYGEDTEFDLKALIHGKEVSIVKDPTYFYLQHSNSAVSSSRLKRFDFIMILEGIVSYYENNSGVYSKEDMLDLINLIITNRIPKAIFGNMLYFFYNDYSYNEVIDRMNQLNLFSKLSKFKRQSSKDLLFSLKLKLFLLSPIIYYKMWKTFKNNI